jgi:cytochrome c oxidase subunit 1
MTFMQTLLAGNKGAFRPETLTPMQKLTLRFVVVGLVYYAFVAIEGMIMRIYAVEPIQLIPAEQYFGILTAHPLVGIFGSTYMLVFGPSCSWSRSS